MICTVHYQNIVHRDIKPSNLLVDKNDRIKIADLGVSTQLREPGELLTGQAGTPAFAAPETTLPSNYYFGPVCIAFTLRYIITRIILYFSLYCNSRYKLNFSECVRYLLALAVCMTILSICNEDRTKRHECSRTDLVEIKSR